MSNNPPFCVLELSKEEAELLLKSAEANMAVALSGLQTSRYAMRPDALRELVNNTELFKTVRNKLRNQGVTNDAD